MMETMFRLSIGSLNTSQMCRNIDTTKTLQKRAESNFLTDEISLQSLPLGPDSCLGYTSIHLLFHIDLKLHL